MARYWEQVIYINNWQKDRIAKLIVNSLFGTVSEKKLTILGFAFKANTNDTRNSASIDICRDLLEEGAILSIYDPKVDSEQIIKDLNINSGGLVSNNDKNSCIFADSIEGALKNSHAVIILTEWKEFEDIEWANLISDMNKPAWIFDTRSVIDVEKAKDAGFDVWQIGNYHKKD